MLAINQGNAKIKQIERIVLLFKICKFITLSDDGIEMRFI